jgi:hypothetical protein
MIGVCRDYRPRRWGRRAGLGVIVVAIGGVVAGLALADAGTPPSGGYVAMTAVTILNNVSVGSGGSVSPPALGASTSVPTNATEVRINVTVGGPQAGKLKIYPAGDPAAGSATSVSWKAGSSNTATVREDVGTNNQVTFNNTSASPATVTATINGYSTQITATNIASDGGTSGQVLTNLGTKTGWAPAGQAYEQANGFNILTLTNAGVTTVASVTVPAGAYLVTFTSTTSDIQSTTPNDFRCDLDSPAGNIAAQFFGSNDTAIPQSSVSGQGLISTATGGTISVQCVDTNAHIQMTYPVLIATAEGTVSGFVTSAPAAPARSQPSVPKLPR